MSKLMSCRLKNRCYLIQRFLCKSSFGMMFEKCFVCAQLTEMKYLQQLQAPPIPSSAPPASVEHLLYFHFTRAICLPYRSNNIDLIIIRCMVRVKRISKHVMNLSNFCVVTSATLEAFDHSQLFLENYTPLTLI